MIGLVVGVETWATTGMNDGEDMGAADREITGENGG